MEPNKRLDVTLAGTPVGTVISNFTSYVVVAADVNVDKELRRPTGPDALGKILAVNNTDGTANQVLVAASGDVISANTVAAGTELVYLAVPGATAGSVEWVRFSAAF